MSPAVLHQALQRLAVLGNLSVITQPEALIPFGRDETHGLAPVLPDAVVMPKDTAGVVAVMRACAALGVPVTPRGGGSGRSGGCVPVYGGVVLCLEQMNRVVEVNAADGVAVVQPGVVLEDLHRSVEDLGLFYPPDPASLKVCTLGGNVAENAGGPRAVKYGVTRDYVLGAEAVLADGQVLRLGHRTLKGVSGYDLAGLMCGSEGTLAVLTEITLKLVARPTVVHTALVFFGSAAQAAGAVTAILTGGCQPRTLEYLDALTLKAIAPRTPVPIPTAAAAALLVEVDGTGDDSVLADLAAVVQLAERAGGWPPMVARNELQRRELWDMRHGLSAATRALTGHKVSEDVVVPRGQLTRMVAEVAAAGELHGLATCAFGHAGDGNLHVQVLFDEPGRQTAVVEACVEDITRRALALGGSISGEHGVGLAKRALLPLEQSAQVIALQRRLKAAFDPAGLLNPGKIFPDP